MSARVGVVLFPGSNCEHDVVEAVRGLGGEAELLWHGDATRRRRRRGRGARRVRPRRLPAARAPSPGSRRSWTRCRSSPPTAARWSGICNGFQVLTEAGLLPGALQKNAGLKFLCTTVTLRVETTESALTSAVMAGRGAAHPDQPLRGQLHLRRRDARRAAGRGSGRGPLRRQPQRVGRRHRRHLQRGPQRGGPHAAPRAGLPCPARAPTDGMPAAAVAARRGRDGRQSDGLGVGERSAGPADAGPLEHAASTPSSRQAA